ncbi:MAG TPA: PH domain-containing protein [Bryobacteraceae bacterium]
MSDLTIRPTAKFIKAGLIAAGVVFLGLEIAYFAAWRDSLSAVFAAVPPLILLWPAVRAIRRHYTKATMIGDRLRYESGITTRSTRNIQISKIQDVRVDQRVMQRLWNVGDLSIETAGETSRLTLANVDDPQRLADEILNRAQHGAGA